MNNSFIAFENILAEEEPIDQSPALRKKETELIKVIEAINGILMTADWIALKALVLDGVTEGLERRLVLESKKNELNNPEIYRLQGQLGWARKFSNLEELSKTFKVELTNIKNQLHAKNN